jgi:hypothetical protein
VIGFRGRLSAIWTDTLTTQEVEFTRRAIGVLSNAPWANPLLSRLRKRGGIKRENMPLMFEVRYAYELHRAGLMAVYEFPTGVKNSTVDFCVRNSATWLIELVSIRSTEDPRKSPGSAQMITVLEKIGQKVLSKGAATKFPPPDQSFHVILVDVRGYLDEGGDVFDYREMAYGAYGIPEENAWMIHHWNQVQGAPLPVRGLFQQSNPQLSARHIRERIHFLGFVREREFKEREIPNVAYYLSNPHLFSTQECALEAFRAYPLQGKRHV